MRRYRRIVPSETPHLSAKDRFDIDLDDSLNLSQNASGFCCEKSDAKSDAEALWGGFFMVMLLRINCLVCVYLRESASGTRIFCIDVRRK